MIAEPAIYLPGEHGMLCLDTARIRNCGSDPRTDIHEYLKELLTIDKQMRKEARCHVNNVNNVDQ